MATRKYDAAVVIGRFQPFHMGHMALISKAVAIAKQVIIIIGSSAQARSVRNPFTYLERARMMRLSLPKAISNKTVFIAQEDSPYDDDLWKRRLVNRVDSFGFDDKRIALVGHKKDESSFYLDMFHKWDFVPVERDPFSVGGTEIREAYLGQGVIAIASAECCPPQVIKELQTFLDTGAYAYLKREWMADAKNRRDWDCKAVRNYGGPTCVTVDALVECKQQILLIRRKKAPGEGLLALPGGFVNPNERINQAVYRELEEETGLSKGLVCEQGSEVFDHPTRSSRGRVITHAFHFYAALQERGLPNIKAADDAAEAKWWPIDEIYDHQDKFHDDHFHIIHKMIGSNYGY